MPAYKLTMNVRVDGRKHPAGRTFWMEAEEGERLVALGAAEPGDELDIHDDGLDQAEADRMAAEAAGAERLAAEKVEADRLSAQEAEAARLAAEKAEADRIAAEQAEADRVAAGRAEMPSVVPPSKPRSPRAPRKSKPAPAKAG